MKDFNDYKKFILDDSETDINKKLSEAFLKTYDEAISKELSSTDALSAAIMFSLSSYSIDLLEKYHLWLHTDES